MNYIYKLTRLPKELHFGGKAEALHRLLQNRAPVPEGYAIAAEAFVQGALCPEAESPCLLPAKSWKRYAAQSWRTD